MNNLFFFLNSFFGDFRCLLVIISFSFLLKLGLFIAIVWQGFTLKQSKKLWQYAVLALVGGMFSDVAWIISLLRTLFCNDWDYRPFLFFIRLSWIWNIIEYQSLSLLIENLLKKQHKISVNQKFFIAFAGLFCLFQLYIAIFKFSEVNPRPAIEFLFMKLVAPYAFLPLMGSIIYVFWMFRSQNKIPKIIKSQVKILVQGIIIPHVISDFIQLYPFSFFQQYLASNYAVVNLSTIFLTIGLYFCARKILGLRFLNYRPHVQTYIPINIIDDFKIVLEQLSHTTEVSELKHIAQSFFRSSLNIQPSRSMLYFCNVGTSSPDEILNQSQSVTERTVELFLNRHDTHRCAIIDFLHSSKILITDEISFNDFYHSTEITREILQFVEQINADVFLPIYDKTTLIAYIIIECDARPNQFYSNIERDEMVIFAGYLANSINLLKNRNLRVMMHKDKELREELYKKHQEMQQYRESIRSFLRDNNRKIGIIFFKNRRFVFGNKDAQQLIQINLNNLEGHPITKTLTRLVHHVESFKTEQTVNLHDTQGQLLVACAVPNLEQNNIIILMYYPEITDIIKKQIDLLKDPTQWDYVLYLETTQTGKLINQLIPGNGEQLLQFKIDLLKIALSKKAILIDLPDDDIFAMVELIHHIGLREVLHTLILQAPEKNLDTAIKLFGINQIYGTSSERPLLERLHNVGTLFIKNIHFLDLETQNYLADFIKYGYFKTIKGDQTTLSDVRIICSSSMDLQDLMHENKFSKSLYNELNRTCLVMPPLHTLSKSELKDLIEGFSNQSLQTDAFKNLLELSDKEREKILDGALVSLSDLKHRVSQLLIKKSKKNEIFHEVQFDPAYNVTDPELMEAARLGKKALQNPKVLVQLMNKFKNQNKIAVFLGVNRSSVHRRLKDYNII